MACTACSLLLKLSTCTFSELLRGIAGAGALFVLPVAAPLVIFLEAPRVEVIEGGSRGSIPARPNKCQKRPTSGAKETYYVRRCEKAAVKPLFLHPAQSGTCITPALPPRAGWLAAPSGTNRRFNTSRCQDASSSLRATTTRLTATQSTSYQVPHFSSQPHITQARALTRGRSRGSKVLIA